MCILYLEYRKQHFKALTLAFQALHLHKNKDVKEMFFLNLYLLLIRFFLIYFLDFIIFFNKNFIHHQLHFKLKKEILSIFPILILEARLLKIINKIKLVIYVQNNKLPLIFQFNIKSYLNLDKIFLYIIK
ncbi:hypothetical protein IMG5_167390 [Ichthyophthirius multifiliis]|uniref:Transmembrane protein n=1 Tax=Ichthyophthirius multifiliis TaxID=5932 RepID=G0R0X4_ICHMU|nr:hypothetical protein IMG5_167390 [Ichthyophthirius multifiliis]EGR28885.1 hypothetical protein IMG5_167390 [Ichthyophthirius multifiliis]|eukprot:XP_004030121.1 hypothetical protein IMG5_167390 [Ichthyophthirius multifiliis]